MFEAGWHGSRRFSVYAILVLIPIAALGLLLTRAVTAEADDDALRDAVSQARSISQTTVETQLNGDQLSGGLSRVEQAEVTALAAPLLKSETVLRFRLRDHLGRIVFDAASPDTTEFPLDEDDEVVEALEEGYIALKTRLGEDEVDGGRADGAEAIEVYMPVYSPSGTDNAVGALEVYIPYGPIGAARDATLRRIYTVIGLGLAMVWVVLAVIMWSVTRRIHKQGARNEYLALHDALTGLPNRTLFADRTEHALATAGRAGLPVSVAVIDLTRFKEINDTLGHGAGDEVLQHVSERIQRVLRPGDSAARLGGDEFGLVLPGIDGEAVRSILTRVQKIIGEDMELAGTPIAVESSIGWAEWPNHGEDLSELVRHADLALYAAKASGSTTFCYHPELAPGDPGRLSLVAELRRALERSELHLEYQPKLDIRTRRVTGFEVLVRWQHPERGLLMPGDFIPLAESTGIIEPLTRWVFEAAVRQLAEWGQAASGLSIAVNISARNLREPDLADWILRTLDVHGIEPDRVVIEITETSVGADSKAATRQVAALDAAGVRVSLDDFGQGYTSLGQLAGLQVRELKIDREFIAAMLQNQQDHTIVASVIALGHQLGLSVVAEGIEEQGVLAALEALGCDIAQGYYFSRPLSPDDAVAFANSVWHATSETR